MTMQPFRIFVGLEKMLHYSDVPDVLSSRQFTEIGDAVRNQVGLSRGRDFRAAQLQQLGIIGMLGSLLPLLHREAAVVHNTL